jgi:hypothetical protein
MTVQTAAVADANLTPRLTAPWTLFTWVVRMRAILMKTLWRAAQ